MLLFVRVVSLVMNVVEKRRWLLLECDIVGVSVGVSVIVNVVIVAGVVAIFGVVVVVDVVVVINAIP